jgi:hypothetical protein
LKEMRNNLAEAEAVIDLVAAPKRPDGTYNRCRDAVGQLAKAYRNKQVTKKPVGDGWCHKCQLKRGGKVPKRGHNGITVHAGVCGGCKKRTTIVPSCDYDWPKKGLKAVWD